jgi:hypothetical protein
MKETNKNTYFGAILYTGNAARNKGCIKPSEYLKDTPPKASHRPNI